MGMSAGDVFAGYKVVSALGAGGMGVVYLVDHPRLPRRDAMKVLPAGLLADTTFRERFNREADLAASLWHPHIVGIHDRGEFDGQLWITMDFVDGTDAARLLTERYPHGLPAPAVDAIVSAIASALDYAHKRGMLHRDVKPANIMVSQLDDIGERRILLADFGIARPLHEISGLTDTNMTVGTVAYAAPEQLMGENVDGRADQYALAASAYELLTGARLFPGANQAAVISRHLSAPPPTLGTTHPHLTALDAVLGRALAKQPADRFPTCTDFARAFTASLPYDAPESAAARPIDPAAATQATPTTAWPYRQSFPTAPTELAQAGWTSYPQFDGQPPTRRPQGARVAVPLLLAILLAGAAAFAGLQFTRESPGAGEPDWQPYVEAAKSFTVDLMSLTATTADEDIQRIIDGSTGQFRDDFLQQRDEFTQTAREAGVTTKATVSEAALDSYEPPEATVLVAASSKVTNNAGKQEEPRSWRLDMTVVKQADEFKVSRVEFVS
jgi:serine/threonine-protein kinase